MWWWWARRAIPRWRAWLPTPMRPGRRCMWRKRPPTCLCDLPERVGVVVQTTQTRDALDDVLEGIRAQGVAAQVKDTVCTATRQRQQAAAELAGQMDAIVVIGGRNSANTTHLAEICAAECPRTHHIESAAELDPGVVRGLHRPWASRPAPAPPTTRSTRWCRRLERM